MKTTIPERWIKPWEFQISREEALYDLQLGPSFLSSLAIFIRDLIGWFGQRKAWRKWRTMLAGKGLDEQLWSVRPPQRQLAHPAVREWARMVLDQSGYDSRVMLPEWEIFWRRKGL